MTMTEQMSPDPDVMSDKQARQTVEALQEATTEAPKTGPEAPKGDVINLREGAPAPTPAEVDGSLDQAHPETRARAVETSSLQDAKGVRIATLNEKIKSAPDKATRDSAGAEYQEGRKADLMAVRQAAPTGGSLVDKIKNLFKRGESKKGGEN